MPPILSSGRPADGTRPIIRKAGPYTRAAGAAVRCTPHTTTILPIELTRALMARGFGIEDPTVCGGRGIRPAPCVKAAMIEHRLRLVALETARGAAAGKL